MTTEERLKRRTVTRYNNGNNNNNNSNNEQENHQQQHQQIEQMEGVIDQGTKMPLVVLDGANVAYAYATAMSEYLNNNTNNNNNSKKKATLEPDVRGIQIAMEFFATHHVRTLAVLPQYWFRSSHSIPTTSTSSTRNNETTKLKILQELKSQGLLVASPPTDDDDAYALTIARREEQRSLLKKTGSDTHHNRNGEGPGFVLSNDLFRDAQHRDDTGTLQAWLVNGRKNSTIGPGRISYTFGDLGTMNDRGEQVFDFIPNPRHPLIRWMEQQNDNDESTTVFNGTM
mmetsp:Transcript_50066/g.57807  ORF Transcript_50066/g.57807 Transcript_50066/m.57807 type:complete len:285 (-) Transcript_50066:107-961(-)